MTDAEVPRASGWRPLLADTALAIVVATIGVVISGINDVRLTSGKPLDWIGYGLIATAGLALVPRRRWPIPTLLLVAALIATNVGLGYRYLDLGYTFGPILLPLLFAVYTAARYLPPARSGPFSVVALGVLLTHLIAADAGLPGLVGLIPASAWVAVPFAVGLSFRLTREAAARERAETIRHHVDTERLRVAQEVHDIVGHGLAAIKMQAEVALHLHEKKPEQAPVALDAISRTSSAALDELRATLAVVRRTAPDDAQTSESRLARLDELRERMRQAGVDVELRVTGEPRTLPAILDLTCYRVIQESLTNVLRHSGADRASVVLGYEPDEVSVVVSNPVVGQPPDSGGLGISGMSERVSALGGRFRAGPVAGGFEVRATLSTGGQE